MNSLLIVLLVLVGSLVIRMLVWLLLLINLEKLGVGVNLGGGDRLMMELGMVIDGCDVCE